MRTAEKLTRILIVALALSGFVVGAQAAGSYPIAGTQPDRRPQDAPVITEGTPRSTVRFFYGVAQPRPPSLSWSNDQGAWYTPFNQPGMTGPYDIRGWHARKGRSQ